MKMGANFNTIALFYDGLCQLVFGQRIKKAQIESLKFIQPHSTILIVGGGTGWILEEIAQIYPSGLIITYIDMSSKMIGLSRKRNFSDNTVNFITASVQNVTLPHQHYDIILTPFFLDCFLPITVQSIVKKLHESLKINGLWLNVDFSLSEKSKYWQKILVKLMYAFFRFTCKIEASRLPTITSYFAFHNYVIVEKKSFCDHFIDMHVFQKGNTSVS